MLPRLRYQTGQALLLVLLSMAVILVVVLSIISRSVTDIKIATQSEESLRAFSAAEAGVEQAIIAGVGSYTNLFEAGTSYSVTAQSGAASEFVAPNDLYAGETHTIWLASHDASGNLVAPYASGDLVVCWGKSGSSADVVTTPAIEASVYYQVAGETQIYREAIDPNTARRANNNFAAPTAGTCSLNGTNFAFTKTLNTAALSNLRFAIFRILYNTDMTQPLGVKNASLPAQGLTISSSGVSGGASRVVQVFQGFAEVPSPFTNAVFSIGGIGQ